MVPLVSPIMEKSMISGVDVVVQHRDTWLRSAQLEGSCTARPFAKALGGRHA